MNAQRCSCKTRDILLNKVDRATCCELWRYRRRFYTIYSFRI